MQKISGDRLHLFGIAWDPIRRRHLQAGSLAPKATGEASSDKSRPIVLIANKGR